MPSFDTVRRIDEAPSLEAIEYLQRVIDVAGGPRPWDEASWLAIEALQEALDRAEAHLDQLRRWNAENASFRMEVTDAELEDGMLFGLGPIVQVRSRGLSKGADLTARRKAEIQRGGNPVTHLPLLRVTNPEDTRTCGNCGNLYRKDFGSGFVWKCKQAPSRANDDGPDVVKRWPACTLFIPIPKPDDDQLVEPG